MSNGIIEVHDFSFKYRDASGYAVHHVSFDIPSGCFFGIVGPNGSGKSTLCNALVGLIPHFFVGKKKGRVRVDGKDVSKTTIAELSMTIGLVFQNPFNQLSYTAETVAEELAYGLCNRGVPRDEMIGRVERIARLVRLDGLLRRNPLELSGGQVQRLALGSTLIMEPKILVLDECATQLDPLGSEEILEIVTDLNSGGMTVVMVDHDMERIARCSNEVLALSAGNQVALGTPMDVFSDKSLESHGIGSPDFVKITEALSDKGLIAPSVEVTEPPTVALVKKALKR